MTIQPTIHNSSQHLTVVIVDDEPSLLELMSEVVIDLGFRPQTFSNADDALAFIVANHSETRLLLTDFCMPGQISGGELALKVSSQYPHIPVIIASGLMDIAMQFGPKINFIPKPWSYVSMSTLILRSTSIPSASQHCDTVRRIV